MHAMRGEARDIAKRLPGINLVDAPAAGSVTAAEEGRLTILTGGTDEAVSQVMPVLAALGTVVRCGDIGTGAALKLVLNTALSTAMAALADPLTIADAADVDRAVALAALVAPGDITAQSECIFQLIAGILCAHGANLDTVLHIRTFMTNLDDLPAYARVRHRQFPGTPPASTTVEGQPALPTRRGPGSRNHRRRRSQQVTSPQRSCSDSEIGSAALLRQSNRTPGPRPGNRQRAGRKLPWAEPARRRANRDQVGRPW
jgi:enamine deaminase RidA (YjgF/YER057c/UK114 family)